MTYLVASSFLSPALQRQANALRNEIDRSTLEMASGRYADMGRALGGDFTALASIDATLAKLAGYKAVTTEAALHTEAMQLAIERIATATEGRYSTLLSLPDSASSVHISAAVTGSEEDFGAAIAAINTRLSGRAIFAGNSANGSPLPDGEAILQALEAITIGSSDPTAIGDMVSDWFNGPAGYATLYTGGSARDAVPISSSESLSSPTSALDPALRESLIGLAMAALVERGFLAGNPSSQTTLLRRATAELLHSSDGRTLLAAEIGVAQGRIAHAETRNAAEVSSLGILRSSMTEADPYENAARLKDAEARLDAFYTLISRLSSLRLSDYL